MNDDKDPFVQVHVSRDGAVQIPQSVADQGEDAVEAFARAELAQRAAAAAEE